MMTPEDLHRWLLAFPYPGAVASPQGADLVITLEGEVLRFDGAWRAPDGQRLPCTLPDVPNAADIHAEICRGLAIARGITGASWFHEAPGCADSDRPTDVPVDRDDALQDRLTDEMDRHRDVEAHLAKMTDAHAVASQRLIGAQREIGEMDALRSQLAVAVGLDGSASLALILEAVKRSRPSPGLNTLSGLLDVLAAPVVFGERRLSTVERAEWALRRGERDRQEQDARIAQLIEAEVLLDVLGVPAYAAVPGDDPGDASEALTLPERLRLHFGEKS